MHYLEDYLEVIELLPRELQNKFSRIRDLDESVQTQLDSLEDRWGVYYHEMMYTLNNLCELDMHIV